MKFQLKLLLLSVAIGFFDLLMYLVLLQVQIVPSSLYIPQELINVFLIILAIPFQFLLLLLISSSFKNNQSILITSCTLIISCFLVLWFSSESERWTYNESQKINQIYGQTEQRSFYTVISTPEGYPIKLLSQSKLSVTVHQKGYTAGYFDKNVYSEQWGNGPNAGNGQSIPDSLQLYWYSFLENKYYKLKTKLDQIKISNYFKKGYQNDHLGDLDKIVKKEYKELIAGIAPDGDVILWISGNDNTKEIGAYKAKEITSAEVRKLTDSRFSNYDIVLAEERKKILTDTCTCENNVQFRKIVHTDQPVPQGIWGNKFRNKYSWKVSVNNTGESKSEMKFYLFNGERFSLFNNDFKNMQFLTKALPEGITFKFIKNQRKYKAYVEFDEAEIFDYFEKLKQNNAEEPVTIVLKIGEHPDKISVQFKTENETYSFKKMKKAGIYED